jgi:TRAP-type C4-dicarboxylate transport system permease small subunit
VAVYERVDKAVFAVEAAIVTAATSAMILFIFLDLTFIFVNGLKIRLFPPEGASPEGLPLGRIGAAVAALVLVLALIGSGVRHHPQWGRRARAQRAGLSALIFGGVCALLFMLVTVHPRWTCLALVTLGGACAAITLRRAPATPERRRHWVILGLTCAALTWFCFTLPDRYSSWTTPYALFLLLWCGFIGASMATSAGRHLRIDAVRKAIPHRLAARYGALSNLVTAAISGVLCYLAWRYTMARFGNPTVAGEIPDWLKALAIPVSLSLVTLRFSFRGILALTGYVEPIVEEVVVPPGPKGDA